MVRRECFEAKCTSCHEPQPTKTEFDITEISVPPADPKIEEYIEGLQRKASGGVGIRRCDLLNNDWDVDERAWYGANAWHGGKPQT